MTTPLSERACPRCGARAHRAEAYFCGVCLAALSAEGTDASLERSPFVGRRRELAAAIRLAHEARAGRHTLIEVRGEAGLGKSRFVDEVLDALALGAPAARARAHPRSRAAPFGLLLELLLALDAGKEGAAEAHRLVERLRSPHELAGEPIAKALELVLAAAAEAGGDPLVLVAEDLHRADHASRAALRSLVGSERLRALLVIVTSRPGLPESWADPTEMHRIELPPLDTVERAQLARFHLEPVRRGSDLTRWIVERAGGNPLAIEQACGLVRGNDELCRAARLETLVRSLDFTPPRSLRDLVCIGLEELPRAQRELLAGLSLLGSEAQTSEISRLDLADRPRAVIEGDLEALARLGLLRRNADSTWEAADPWIDEAVSDLSTDARAELHRRCAEVLRVTGAGRSGPQLSARIGRHYDRAGEADDAHAFLCAAGEGALLLGAFDEAARSLRRAWALVASGAVETSSAERSGLALSLATALNALDQPAEAAAVLEDIEDGALGEGTVAGARLLIQLGWTLFDGARNADRAREAIERGLRWLEGTEAAVQEGGLGWFYLARIETLDGRTERALAHTQFIFREAARRGNAVAQSVALVYGAAACCDAGRLRRAIDDLRYGLEIAEMDGSKLARAFAYVFAAKVWLHAGRIDEALHFAKRGRALGEEMGQEGVIVQALIWSGCVQLAKGENDAAMHTHRELLQIHPESPSALAQFAQAQLECGAPAAAVETVVRCLDMEPAKLVEIRARRTLGLALSRRHPRREADALVEAQRSLELAEALGLRVHSAFAHLALAEIAWVSGRREQGQAHLSHARNILTGCEMPLPPTSFLSDLSYTDEPVSPSARGARGSDGRSPES